MFVWLLVCIILLLISVNDFLFLRIENEYVLLLIGLYIVSCCLGTSGKNFINSAIIASTTLILTVAMVHYNILGGGDAKLLFPLILFAENSLTAFLIGLSVGGVLLAIVCVIAEKKIFFFRRKLIHLLIYEFRNRNTSILLSITLLSLRRIMRRRVKFGPFIPQAMRQEIPYGIALSCGGMWVVFENLMAR